MVPDLPSNFKFVQDVVRDDEENERHLRDHGKLAHFIIPNLKRFF